jgi:hypothetical protein
MGGVSTANSPNFYTEEIEQLFESIEVKGVNPTVKY